MINVRHLFHKEASGLPVVTMVRMAVLSQYFPFSSSFFYLVVLPLLPRLLPLPISSFLFAAPPPLLSQALSYIAGLDFPAAESNMKMYGKLLMSSLPDQTTAFLKQLCTDYKPANDE